MSDAQDPSDIQTYHGFREDEERAKRSDRRRERITRAIDEGHEAIAAGEYDHLATIVDVLLSELDLCAHNVDVYDEQLSRDQFGWHWPALRVFFQHRTEYLTASNISELDVYQTRTTHDQDPEDHRREILEDVFESLESAAVVEDWIQGQLDDSQPAYAYRHQIGRRYLRPDSSAGGDLELISNDDELKATLFTGSQGSGKSTALETVVEDRVANGHKIVDIVDFHKSENAMYDVVCRDDDLEAVREELGLQTGFGMDYEPPEVEVLAPLTSELSETLVPYDTEADESVVRPFTIPASELTYRQLVMLLPHTTRTQENYLKSAHQMLSKTDMDWTLRDVADTVRNETNAGDAVADRIERALETAQNKSFIRDTECDHQLTWDGIMQNPDVVTAFTAHIVEEKSDQMLVISYLLDCIYEQRKRLIRERKIHEYPTMTIVMRELHHVAPRKKSEQDSENTIEGYMIDTLSEVFALMRHVKMEILADTQKFHQQLSDQVSGLFHRIYCFGGQKPDVRRVFSTRIDDTDPVESVAQFETGRCALVSGDGYKMPLQFAPPRCHHLDTDRDGDGFSMRARALENEELVAAPWDAEIPERLAFGSKDKKPIEKFFAERVRKTGSEDDYVFKQDVTERFNKWARVNGFEELKHDTVQRYVRQFFGLSDEESTRRMREGEREYVYLTLQFKNES